MCVLSLILYLSKKGILVSASCMLGTHSGLKIHQKVSFSKHWFYETFLATFMLCEEPACCVFPTVVFPKITKLHLRDFAKKCTFCLKLQEGKKGRSSIGVVGSSLGL